MLSILFRTPPVYFIVLAIVMALTPLWYKLLFNRSSQRQKHIEEIKKNLEKIENIEQRQAIQQHLANNGELPPRKAQRWALIFLGWCFLFEMFFVSSWVKDMALVWQPDWVNSVVHWMQIHATNARSWVLPEGKYFTVSLGDEGSMLKIMFATEQAFLISELGKACLLFHAWNMLSFLPILIAYIISFWQLIGWTGMNEINHKKNSSLWQFIYSSALTFAVTLLGIGAVFMLLRNLDNRVMSVMSVVGWLNDLWLHIFYFWTILALAMYANWFFFFKNLMLRVYRKFV